MAYKFNPFTGNFDDVVDPSGADTQIQFNDDGSFGASPDLTWDDTGKVLGITGDIDLDDGGTYTTTLQVISQAANETITQPAATGMSLVLSGPSTLAAYAGVDGGFYGALPYSIGGGRLEFSNALGFNPADGTLSCRTFSSPTIAGNTTFTGRFISSLNGAASAPPGTFTGTWFTGGTATTTKPQVLIEPTGTTSTAWRTSGTGLGINAASGFGGRHLDLQTNGTSLFSVGTDGPVYTVRCSGRIIAVGAGAQFDGVGDGGIRLNSDRPLGWTHSTNIDSGGQDTQLWRDAVSIIAQRRGTDAQTFRCYGTYADASNYVRAALSSTSTAVTLAAETAGTGADDIPLNLTAAGTGTVKVNSVAEVVVSSTVANLPATPVVGMLTRVTDATAPAVGSTVAGGGAAAALCWYNGANWTVIGV